MVTGGSLFSGIGGMDLAASLAGIDILWQVENDKFCQQVLKKQKSEYWRNATLFTDIRDTSSQQLASVDIVFGGFPCQDVSTANRLRSTVAESSRSGLWAEFCRVVSDIRPSVVVVENVPGILTAGAESVIADLARMGYVGQSGIVSAADAGFSHHRDRWFLVGYSDSFRQRQSQSTLTGQTTLHQNGDNPLQDRQRDFIPAIRDNGKSSRTKRAARQSRMGKPANGLPGWMVRRVARWDESQNDWEAPRVTPTIDPLYSAKKQAIGNAVVPAQVYPIFALIAEILNN